MPVGRALQSLGARGRSEGGAGFPALLGAVVPQARVAVRRRVAPCLQAAVTPESSKGPQPSPLDLGENGTEREGEMSEGPAHSCASWSSGSCAMWGNWDHHHPVKLGGTAVTQWGWGRSPVSCCVHPTALGTHRGSKAHRPGIPPCRALASSQKTASAPAGGSASASEAASPLAPGSPRQTEAGQQGAEVGPQAALAPVSTGLLPIVGSGPALGATGRQRLGLE